MLRKLRQLLEHPRFLTAMMVLFALQAVIFSILIPYKSPSDEEYHFRFTYYYAQRSIVAGPIIDDQTDNFDIGDIQRTPGYLYHYLSSFVLKLIQPIVTSEEGQVIALRIVNVGLGVITLLLIVSLLRRIGARGLTMNLVVAWLAITTMFVWLFAALNYDNLAIVLFMILLHLLLSLYQKVSINRVLQLLAVTLALMLTKETFLPSIVIGYGLLVFGLLRKTSLQENWQQLVQSVKAGYKNPKSRWLLLGLSLLVVILLGLFGERYGQNYVKYKKTTPSCNQVHSEAECLQNSIYRRNTGQRQEYVVYLQNGGKPSMNFANFTVKWWRFIYERTYFFRGMATTNPTWQARLVALATAPTLLLFAVVGWRKQKYSRPEKALFVLTISYVVLVFLYNYNAYRYYGYPFAIQGRYLLPVLPFFYYFVVSALLAAYRGYGLTAKKMMAYILVGLLVINIIFHLPLMIYRHKGDLLKQPEARIIRQLS